MIGKKDARAGRERRRKRVRGKIHGTSERLRLCVFRSSAHIYAQIIDDDRVARDSKCLFDEATRVFWSEMMQE